MFSSINILIGTWILYLPYIKNKFLLNDTEVGVALFLPPVAYSFLSMVPALNVRLGTGRSTKIGVLLLALAFNLPLLAPSYVLLCASLLLIGLLSGFTDVSMNALMSIIETKEEKHLMSAAHGFFSLGGFIGAGIGVCFSFLSHPSGHMLFISVAVILSNLWLAKYYTKINEAVERQENAKKQPFFKRLRPVISLSLVAFVVMFNEGAVEHWSNLYLFEVVNVPQNQAGYGFVLFSLSMTLGRFLGDGFSEQFGSIRTLGYGRKQPFLGMALF